MSSCLNQYLHAFRELNVNRSGPHASPHKPCMLLAVLGLAESGQLEQNQIRYEPALFERYARFFNIVRTDRDHLNPYFPFFHLSKERSGFWHLHAVPGREAIVQAMKTARSMRDISQNIEFAYLDEELHSLALDEQTRGRLRQELVTFWFGQHATALFRALSEECSIDRYESLLRKKGRAEVFAANEELTVPTRNAAFRRVVSEVYDYRCAASGWRIILPDRVMVEAAHLIPFPHAYDDDPRNGIALSPSYHWALDAHIIAPGPDYKWHVSSILDERVPDNQPLLALRGKSIILPRNESMWPKKEALQWRVDRLLGSY